jgi:hypothetical protein
LVASTLCSEGFDFPSCAGDLFPLKIELNLVCLDIEVELRPSSSGHGVLLADNTISDKYIYLHSVSNKLSYFSKISQFAQLMRRDQTWRET